MELVETAVESLQAGMVVDLETCPYLKDKPASAMEYGSVAGVDVETPECTVVMYEGVDHVGYPAGTKLMAGWPDAA